MSTPNVENPSTREEIELLLPWFVNDTLTEAERQKVKSYLATSPECRAIVDELRQIKAGVGRPGVTPIVPEPNVEGLMARLDADERRFAWRRPLAIAAAVALVAAVPVINYLSGGIDEPPQFNTATTPADVPLMDLVFEVTFASDVDAAERADILERFELPMEGNMESGRTLRIQTTRPVAAPAVINALAEELAAAKGVVSATVEMPAPAAEE